MASLLTHAGLPMSEPMAFGLASGLAFAYLPIVKLSGMPLIAYRMPPRYLIKTLSKRLGARLHSRTFGNPEQGRLALNAALDDGRLAGLQSSVFWLPYFPAESASTSTPTTCWLTGARATTTCSATRYSKPRCAVRQKICKKPASPRARWPPRA